MARSGKLKEVEQRHGELDKVIPKLVNEKGQAGAAAELNITQATVSFWLKRAGYVRVIRWEKAEVQS